MTNVPWNILQGLVPTDENNVPLMPDVLKVFLENGQTKSFKYDLTTTVRVSASQKLYTAHLNRYINLSPAELTISLYWRVDQVMCFDVWISHVFLVSDCHR